ncbi:MAG TPA: F0F1 ATP synthase subunit delta [Candidatus Binatia bacterium]|jgi:F0F1-type ATP synthase delta subunit|nr:F0F1 ATP synthase subunit delta [Candidatus Binatia bacterium]
MRLTPKDLARAYYLAARQEPEKRAAALAKNLMEAARRRGIEGTLGEVLKALPAAMEEVDAESRITVESAHPMDEAAALAAVAAAGLSTENAEVVRMTLPELVSGVRVRTRDGVLDATGRRTLDELMKAMRKAAAED